MTVVQTVYANSTASTIQVSFANNITAGNAVIVCVEGDDVDSASGLTVVDPNYGPTDISSGGTYNGGTYTSTDTGTPAITISTTDAVTLENLTIIHAGIGVNVTPAGCNVTMYNCTLTGTSATSPLEQWSFTTQQCSYIDIQNCQFNYGHGIWLNNQGADVTHLVVKYNNFVDISAMVRSDQYVGAVHGYEIEAVNGATVQWNRVTNHYGNSMTEDVFSFAASNGASGAPILWDHNLINGSYPYPGSTDDANNGAGFTGSGTNMGDEGGSYHTLSNVTAVRTTNVGLQIASGANMEITNCTAVSTGYGLTDTGATNYLMTSTFGGGIGTYGGGGAPETLSNCLAGWERQNGSGGIAGRVDFYTNESDGTYSGLVSISDDPITDTDVNNAINNFESTVTANGVTIGLASSSGTDTYTQEVADTTNHGSSIWATLNSRGGYSTVTVSNNTNPNGANVWMYEVSGITGLDQVATSTAGSATNTFTSGTTPTTTQATEICFGVGGSCPSTTATLGAPAGWTNLPSQNYDVA